MRLPELVEEYRSQIILGLLGLFLMGVGVLSVVFVSLNRSQPEVEIISADEESESDKEGIIVDVEGAVEKPGIYSLPGEARVNDALVVAGGLSSDADREWVAKSINLAQILSDGIKIYIPFKAENISDKNSALSVVLSPDQGEVIGLSIGGKININTAAAGELDTLWGIGEKRAAAIIAERPFGSIEELLEKKIIPLNVFERIKDEITVY